MIGVLPAQKGKKIYPPYKYYIYYKLESLKIDIFSFKILFFSVSVHVPEVL